jgi:hypothetical protein
MYVLNSGRQMRWIRLDYHIHHDREKIICCRDTRCAGHMQSVHDGRCGLTNALKLITGTLKIALP